MTRSLSAILPSSSPYLASLCRNFSTSSSVLLTPVYVLMFLNAVSTKWNSFISRVILSRNMRSTKRWQRYTLYQFFYLMSFSWTASSPISCISSMRFWFFTNRSIFSSTLLLTTPTCCSRSSFSADRWERNLFLNFSVRSSSPFWRWL